MEILMRHLGLWLLGSLIASPAGAADTVLHDLRIGYAPVLANDFDLTGEASARLADGTGSVLDEQFDFSSRGITRVHDRWGVAYVASLGPLKAGRGALAYGLEGAYDRTMAKENDNRCEGRTWILDGFLGWAWALSSRWHIEEGAQVGIGRALWHFRGDPRLGVDDALDDRSSGFVWEYGFRIGVCRTSRKEGWQIGAEVRYLVMRSQATFADTVEDGVESGTAIYEPDIVFSGLGGMLTVGYRF
jgi:hypothetical protein